MDRRGLVGCFDSCESGYLAGWAYDGSGDAVDVDIVIDGARQLTLPATKFRGDLKAAGIGSGCYGFSFQLHPSVFALEPVEIRVLFHGTDVELGGSPRTLAAAAPVERPSTLVLSRMDDILARAGASSNGWSPIGMSKLGAGISLGYETSVVGLHGTLGPGEVTAFSQRVEEGPAIAVSLPHGRVYPWGAFGHRPGRLIDSSFSFMKTAEYTPAVHVKDGLFSIAPGAMAEAADIDAEVVHIWRPGAYNHYHWVIDTLPQLWALGESPFADKPLLINRRDFRRPRAMSSNEIALRLSCLEALGFDASRRFEIDADICDARVLHLPSASLGLTLGAARAIFERLRSAVSPAPSGHRPERIYLTRRGAGARRILNEPDLMVILAPLGFESVSLDDMPLTEQIGLFSAARMVVSAHGAGLANLVFSEPGVKFLEILPANQPDRRWIFGRVAAVFGHRRVVVESRPFPHDREDPDHLVDQATVNLGLELLLAS